jgi:hypothetical protein
MREPHRWGFSVSRSGYFQVSAINVDAAVGDLKSKGVAFEHYDDMPGVEWNNDVASLGDMGKAAWFKDSENNILCIDDGFPGERFP